MTTSADIAIVGGGVAGLSLAAAIGGRASVVVLETEPQLFHHTSSRSAQQMQPTYGPAPVRRLTAASIRMVERIAEGLGRPVFTSRPLLWLHGSPDRAAFDTVLATVPGLEEVSPDEAVRLLPALRRDLLVDAAIDRSAVEVDVPALLAAYRERALACGVRVLPLARVEGADRVGDVWRLRTATDAVEAPIVVDAAGAWADEVAALLGAAPQRLVPKRRTVAVARGTARSVDPGWPMAADVADRYYFRPRGDTMLCCALEDEPSAPEDARPRPDVVATAVARVNAVTELALGAPIDAWTGLRTVAADGLPVVGRDAAVDGLYWLAGQAGFGIQTSAALSALVAADLLGEPHDLDQVLAEIGPGRAALRTVAE